MSSQYVTLEPIFDQLRGDRVLIRPYELEDAIAFQGAIVESREHLRPWESFADDFQTLEEIQDWIVRKKAAWLLRETLACGMWHLDSGRYLGGLDLVPKQWRLPWFMIAYWIRKSEEGHGYVSEGVRLLTDYAFEQLGAKRVELGIDAKNRRSIAVAERLGFRLEGRLRNTGMEEDGEMVDNLRYALIPTDPRWP